MATTKLNCPDRSLVEKARSSLIAVYDVFGTGLPLREARTNLEVLNNSEDVALTPSAILEIADGISYLNGVADGNDVDVEQLVDAIKFADHTAQTVPFLVNVAKFAKELPSVLLADDDETNEEISEAREASETFEANGDFDDETDDDSLERLEAAVKKDVDTVCWAREETELAMHDLEQSFRALIVTEQRSL